MKSIKFACFIFVIFQHIHLETIKNKIYHQLTKKKVERGGELPGWKKKLRKKVIP